MRFDLLLTARPAVRFLIELLAVLTVLMLASTMTRGFGAPGAAADGDGCCAACPHAVNPGRTALPAA